MFLCESLVLQHTHRWDEQASLDWSADRAALSAFTPVLPIPLIRLSRGTIFPSPLPRITMSCRGAERGQGLLGIG